VVGANAPRHTQEFKLAGLRLGIDTIESASRKLGKGYELTGQAEDGRAVIWRRICPRPIEVKAGADSRGLIESLSVEEWHFPGEADCGVLSNQAYAKTLPSTGRGLKIYERCERVEEIYGTPQSKASSTNGDEQLESYVYTFESNRKNAALKLEATCETSSNRVTRIQLETVEASAQ
jgi:hypothetical protein